MLFSTVRPAEDRRLLREITDPFARPDVHRIGRHVMVVEQHAARVRPCQADDHAERRGLAGTVRAEQADDLAG